MTPTTLRDELAALAEKGEERIAAGVMPSFVGAVEQFKSRAWTERAIILAALTAPELLEDVGELVERLEADASGLQRAAMSIRPHPQNSMQPVHAARVASFVDKEVTLAHLSILEAATIIRQQAAQIASLTAERDGLREAGIKLALEAGKLNIALDGQERFRRQRQAVVDAMADFNFALTKGSDDAQD